VLIAAALLISSALLNMAEISLFSLPRAFLKRIEQAPYPPTSERAIARLMKHSKETLATILIGNMMVSIAVSILIGQMLEQMSGDNSVLSFVLGTAVGTILLLVLGEILPKTIALERAEVVARMLAPVVVSLSGLLAPIRWVLLGISNAVFRLFNMPPEGEQEVTEQEIKWLVAKGFVQGEIEPDEREMIEGVLELSDMTVEDIMTARANLVAFPENITRMELEAKLKTTARSRVFLFRESIDNIVGVLHLKDLMMDREKTPRELMRDPIFVPPKKPAVNLLNDFRRRRQQIAVVIDEYGGTIGCITMNDVLEEIISGVLDVDDMPSRAVRKIDDRTFEIEGLEEIDRVNEQLSLSLHAEDVNTMSGLIMNVLGDFPRAGDEVMVDGVKLRVLRMAARHIAKVLLTLPATSEPAVQPADSTQPVNSGRLTAAPNPPMGE